MVSPMPDCVMMLARFYYTSAFGSPRQEAVGNFQRAMLASVAQGGQIGHQAHVPEEHRYRGVRGYREHVPHQRAAEVGLDAHGVRVWEEPVHQPGAAQVENREHARAGYREDGHGFGE